MDELKAQPADFIETPESNENLINEINDQTYEPGTVLEKISDFADAESIQAFFKELMSQFAESIGEAVDAYLDKVHEHAQERQSSLEQPLEDEPLVFTESQARAMVDQALQDYQRSYAAGLAAAGGSVASETSVKEDMKPGAQTAEVDPSGVEELPSQPVEEVAEVVLIEPGLGILDRHTVLPGESITSLATLYYDDPDMWGTIYNANRDVLGGAEEKLIPGQELVIPSVRLEDVQGIDATAIHQMSGTDTLSGLALQYYGHADLWPQILAANPGSLGGNPNRIQPGSSIIIPSLDAMRGTAPHTTVVPPVVEPDISTRGNIHINEKTDTLPEEAPDPTETSSGSGTTSTGTGTGEVSEPIEPTQPVDKPIRDVSNAVPSVTEPPMDSDGSDANSELSGVDQVDEPISPVEPIKPTQPLDGSVEEVSEIEEKSTKSTDEVPQDFKKDNQQVGIDVGQAELKIEGIAPAEADIGEMKELVSGDPAVKYFKVDGIEYPDEYEIEYPSVDPDMLRLNVNPVVLKDGSQYPHGLDIFTKDYSSDDPSKTFEYYFRLRHNISSNAVLTKSQESELDSLESEYLEKFGDQGIDNIKESMRIEEPDWSELGKEFAILPYSMFKSWLHRNDTPTVEKDEFKTVITYPDKTVLTEYGANRNFLKTVEIPGGSKLNYYGDGTTVFYRADRVKITEFPDGNFEIKYTDGIKIEYRPRSEVFPESDYRIIYKDGSEWSRIERGDGTYDWGKLPPPDSVDDYGTRTWNMNGGFLKHGVRAYDGQWSMFNPGEHMIEF